MSKLTAVILDDEQDSIKILQLEIERHCPVIKKIHTYSSPLMAIEDIPKIAPHIVFIDIEMPGINGFELLERLSPLQFNVIFVTAFNQYAIRAFRFNALDYLLKPVDVDELKIAVSKAEKQPIPNKTQLIQAEQQVKGTIVTKIALSSSNGITFIDLNDIVYVEANNNYSKIFLANSSTYLLSKTLKDTQDILEESHFLRIHRQYIVNLNSVKHFNKNEGLITLDTKIQLPIVKNQYEKFLEKYYRL
jgi:two-component system LytT family response regulator